MKRKRARPRSHKSYAAEARRRGLTVAQVMSKRRRNPSRLSRRKRTGILIAATGIAGGLFAVLLWPKIRARLQQPTINVGVPTLTTQVAALLE